MTCGDADYGGYGSAVDLSKFQSPCWRSHTNNLPGISIQGLQEFWCFGLTPPRPLALPSSPSMRFRFRVLKGSGLGASGSRFGLVQRLGFRAFGVEELWGGRCFGLISTAAAICVKCDLSGPPSPSLNHCPGNS